MNFNVFKSFHIHHTYNRSFVGAKSVSKNRSGIHFSSFESASTGMIVYEFLNIHCR